MAKYWLFITHHYCPVCGGGHTYRERRFTPKPEDPNERVEWVDAYDWCNAL